MRRKYLIAGLGNPGAQYAHTRHNLGFMTADALASDLGGGFRKKNSAALIAETNYAGCDVIIAKPQLFMNRSGESIAPLVRYLNITLEELLVVVDDADLPLGKLRLRKQGSAGGHNGLKSIIAHLDANNFPRLRLGMGRPDDPGAMIDHVLSDFSRGERPVVQESVQRAVGIIRDYIEYGIDQAMNRCNAD
ncbi:MAG TPA: aminoacyl-tRNA hydrolase [bacterium]|nr:aminoacyl-tRNA hydrolase [bacterium]HPR88662.1 aminoacyl-tRNA hydrolase [bacterium]